MKPQIFGCSNLVAINMFILDSVHGGDTAVQWKAATFHIQTISFSPFWKYLTLNFNLVWKTPLQKYGLLFPRQNKIKSFVLPKGGLTVTMWQMSHTICQVLLLRANSTRTTTPNTGFIQSMTANQELRSVPLRLEVQLYLSQAKISTREWILWGRPCRVSHAEGALVGSPINTLVRLCVFTECRTE